MIIFTFSYDQKTQQAAFAGNISIQEALQILQQLAIQDAVNKATANQPQKEEPHEQNNDEASQRSPH